MLRAKRSCDWRDRRGDESYLYFARCPINVRKSATNSFFATTTPACITAKVYPRYTSTSDQPCQSVAKFMVNSIYHPIYSSFLPTSHPLPPYKPRSLPRLNRTLAGLGTASFLIPSLATNRNLQYLRGVQHRSCHTTRPCNNCATRPRASKRIIHIHADIERVFSEIRTLTYGTRQHLEPRGNRMLPLAEKIVSYRVLRGHRSCGKLGRRGVAVWQASRTRVCNIWYRRRTEFCLAHCLLSHTPLDVPTTFQDCTFSLDLLVCAAPNFE